MSIFSEQQEMAVALLESIRVQTSLLEATDGGAPSNQWSILTAMRLQALVFCMTPEHRLAGSKIVEEFCQLVGVDQEAMERLVGRETTPTEES